MFGYSKMFYVSLDVVCIKFWVWVERRVVFGYNVIEFGNYEEIVFGYSIIVCFDNSEIVCSYREV